MGKKPVGIGECSINRQGKTATYGGYFLGSKRHEEQLQTVKAELLEVKRAQESSCRQSRVDELLLNLTREQMAIAGRVQQINGDVQVLLSKTK